MIKIGLISAMVSESESIMEWLGKSQSVQQIGEFTVSKYVKSNAEIYHITSGIGEIMASAATQALILKFGVQMIINFGLCGSVYGKKISQVVAVKGVVHYDFDISALDDVPVGRYPNFGEVVINTDEKLLALLSEICPECDQVICASADKFVSDSKTKKWLYNTFKADICEMESAGILISAKVHNVPCLLIKTISDADNHKEEFYDFKQNCDYKFAQILDKVINVVAK